MLVAFTDQCIALPMSDLATLVNMGWTLGNGSATDDLPSSVPSSCISFTPLSLASEISVEGATGRFIRIDMAIDRLVAHGHFSSNLFGTPLALQIDLHRQPVRWIDLAGIAAIYGSILC